MAVGRRFVEYVFHFGVVWDNFGLLLEGAWLTVRLSAITMALGLIVGVMGAWAKSSGGPVPRATVQIYVEVIRNPPFLVPLLLIYLGLPALGLRLSPDA